jgi:glycosyltransferase involved in cell wall biosynthesis
MIQKEPNQNQVLLISYYWPPSGGAGVHRWLRFSKYFKDFGWNLHVYCPQDAFWPVIDESLNELVSDDLYIIRRKIFEPQKFLGKSNPNASAGLTKHKKSSFLQNLIIWLRGNLFVPDSRVFWVKPSIRKLRKYLQEHPEIKTIISTGPPHSMHLIARQLKKEFKLNWVADFRDPWTEIDFYKDLKPSKPVDRLHKKLEKAVLTEADHIVTVSEGCAEGLNQISNRKIEVIYNGFNTEEFDEKAIQLDEKFTIAHFGSMPFSRNPEVLWQTLAKLKVNKHPILDELLINLIGTVDIQVKARIQFYQLEAHIQYIPSISFNESIEKQKQSQVLLLVGNNTGNVKGILTGKVFEYIGVKRPILAIGEKNSDLENLIRTSACGGFIAFEDIDTCERFLIETFQKYQSKTNYLIESKAQNYNSKYSAEKYCNLLNNSILN